jgi:hypothetical protein
MDIVETFDKELFKNVILNIEERILNQQSYLDISEKDEDKLYMIEMYSQYNFMFESLTLYLAHYFNHLDIVGEKDVFGDYPNLFNMRIDNIISDRFKDVLIILERSMKRKMKNVKNVNKRNFKDLTKLYLKSQLITEEEAELMEGIHHIRNVIFHYDYDTQVTKTFVYHEHLKIEMVKGEFMQTEKLYFKYNLILWIENLMTNIIIRSNEKK